MHFREWQANNREVATFSAHTPSNHVSLHDVIPHPHAYYFSPMVTMLVLMSMYIHMSWMIHPRSKRIRKASEIALLIFSTLINCTFKDFLIDYSLPPVLSQRLRRLHPPFSGYFCLHLYVIPPLPKKERRQRRGGDRGHVFCYFRQTSFIRDASFGFFLMRFFCILFSYVGENGFLCRDYLAFSAKKTTTTTTNNPLSKKTSIGPYILVILSITVCIWVFLPIKNTFHFPKQFLEKWVFLLQKTIIR